MVSKTNNACGTLWTAWRQCNTSPLCFLFWKLEENIFLVLPLDSLLPRLMQHSLSTLRKVSLLKPPAHYCNTQRLLLSPILQFQPNWHHSRGDRRQKSAAQESVNNWQTCCRIIFLRHTGWCDSVSVPLSHAVNPDKETLSQNSESIFSFGPILPRKPGPFTLNKPQSSYSPFK